MNIFLLIITLLFFTCSHLTAMIVDFEYNITEIRAVKRKAVANPTGYSPVKKKPRSHDLSKASDAMVRRVLINNQKVNNINCPNPEYRNGWWGYIDASVPETSVFFQGDHTGWDQLVEMFFDENRTFTSEIDFLSTLILFIYDSDDEQIELLSFNKEDELVCRHKATFALALVTKILHDDRCIFRGTIQPIAGDFVTNKWKCADDGHMWNCIHLFDIKDNKSYWHFDAHHLNFVRIEANKSLDEHVLFKANQYRIFEKKLLKLDNICLDFVRLTSEKLGFTPDNVRTLTQDAIVSKHASQKFHANYLLPLHSRKRLEF